MTAEPCRYLEWDSAFFGKRIAQVEGQRLDTSRLEAIRRWCEDNEIACLYLLADSDHAETVRLAEDGGFRLVDIRCTLIRELSVPTSDEAPAQATAHMREARQQDLPAIRAIARKGYSFTRFYYDGHFPAEKCAGLYEAWIENSLRGYSNAVFVAENEGRIAGYITCNLPRRSENSRIGLVGIASWARQQGIGRALVGHALIWFRQQQSPRVEVVTQGRNIPALRLYQRSGFLVDRVQLWYHKWF